MGQNTRGMTNDIFARLEAALRRAEAQARPPGTAAEEAARRRSDELRERYERAILRARRALQRARARRRAARTAPSAASQEARAKESKELEEVRRLTLEWREEKRRLEAREKERRANAVRLAKLFARALADNGSLRVELKKAMAAASSARAAVSHPAAPSPERSAGPDPERELIEHELAEGRENVVNLMLRLSRERRRWKAALVAVRRRLKSLRPPARQAAGRLGDLQRELDESQATAANLLVELSRQARRAEADRRKRARKGKGVPVEPRVVASAGGHDVGTYVSAASARLDQGLRALVESPSADAEAVTAVAEDGLRLIRLLRLAAELASSTEPAVVLGTELRDIVDKRLDMWESDIRRRRFTLLRTLDTQLPRVLIDAGGLEAMVDELVGHSLGRLPRGGMVVIKAGASEDGGLCLEVQDSGQGAPRIERPEAALVSDGALGGLGLSLARELAARWGGALESSPVPSGRGRRLSLFLRSPTGRKVK